MVDEYSMSLVFALAVVVSAMGARVTVRVPSLVLARIAGFVWLALAFGLLLLMLLAATPAFLIFAAMGLAVFIAAALLLVRPVGRRLFVASATLARQHRSRGRDCAFTQRPGMSLDNAGSLCPLQARLQHG